MTRPTPRRAALLALATAPALALPLLSATTLAAPAQAAPAVAPAALVAADTPATTTCTPITPTDLSTQVTQPKAVWDNVGIAFTGHIPDHAPSGACVVIPTDVDLPLRTHGDYVAVDEDGARVGLMRVTAAGITFLFDDDYTNTHTHVSFHGSVLAGIDVDTTTAVKPFDLTWTIEGLSVPVVVHVPGCADCGQVPKVTYKWANMDDSAGTVGAGVVLGTDAWANIPGTDDTATLTMSDTLGPGQRCTGAQLWQLTPPARKITDVGCDRLSVTFPAVRGRSYTLSVSSVVTDTTLSGYSDTGTISATGAESFSQTVTAPWHSGAAGGAGGGVPTPTPTAPSPTPTTPAPTPTAVPSTTTAPSPAPTVPTPAPTAPTPTPTVPTPAPTVPTPAPSTTTPSPTPTPTPTRLRPLPVPPRQALPVVNPGPNARGVRPDGQTMRVFQVDRYVAPTQAWANRLAHLDDDGVLRYREDRAFWGRSRHALVGIPIAFGTTEAEVWRLLNASTPANIGDVHRRTRMPGARPGAYTVAWELGLGSSAARPWGPRGTVPQRYYGRS